MAFAILALGASLDPYLLMYRRMYMYVKDLRLSVTFVIDDNFIFGVDCYLFPLIYNKKINIQ